MMMTFASTINSTPSEKNSSFCPQETNLPSHFSFESSHPKTHSIPISNSLLRTASEMQLCVDEALAEQRDRVPLKSSVVLAGSESSVISPAEEKEFAVGGVCEETIRSGSSTCSKADSPDWSDAVGGVMWWPVGSNTRVDDPRVTKYKRGSVVL